MSGISGTSFIKGFGEAFGWRFCGIKGPPLPSSFDTESPHGMKSVIIGSPGMISLSGLRVQQTARE